MKIFMHEGENNNRQRASQLIILECPEHIFSRYNPNFNTETNVLGVRAAWLLPLSKPTKPYQLEVTRSAIKGETFLDNNRYTFPAWRLVLR